MNRKIISLIVLFLLFTPLISSASLSITFIPENINQPYIIYIHNKNNSFNQTYEVNGNVEITGLDPGLYYVNITSENYNKITLIVNLSENTTLQLYFNSDIIGYGIQDYNYLIFTLMLIFTIFGLMIVMVYYMKGVKIK